jgi:uncharacterized glyoxalase superfamily protein PhnB
VVHAELALGPSLLMLGTARPAEEGGYSAPAPPAGASALYALVDDLDAHHERARAAGAQVTTAPYDTDYGSREYTARDIEGNVWSFGTYDPWAGG